MQSPATRTAWHCHSTAEGQSSAHDLRELRLRDAVRGTLLTASLRASFSGTSMHSRACSSSSGGMWASKLAASCLGSTPAASAPGLTPTFPIVVVSEVVYSIAGAPLISCGCFWGSSVHTYKGCQGPWLQRIQQLQLVLKGQTSHRCGCQLGLMPRRCSLFRDLHTTKATS